MLNYVLIFLGLLLQDAPKTRGMLMPSCKERALLFQMTAMLNWPFMRQGLHEMLVCRAQLVIPVIDQY